MFRWSKAGFRERKEAQANLNVVHRLNGLITHYLLFSDGLEANFH